MIGVSVLCAETDERAQWLAGAGHLAFVRLRSGRPGPFPTPEEAAATHTQPGCEKNLARSRLATRSSAARRRSGGGLERAARANGRR